MKRYPMRASERSRRYGAILADQGVVPHVEPVLALPDTDDEESLTFEECGLTALVNLAMVAEDFPLVQDGKSVPCAPESWRDRARQKLVDTGWMKQHVADSCAQRRASWLALREQLVSRITAAA